ncbi:MAG: ATP-binding cassette domain-containing protein [Bacteroidaceae bacterium]|nr:ATP-binding cassette domain-containing protein [Bacteroidaceae bacterium]
MPIISYKNVDIHIDSKIILEDVTFTLDAGEFAYLLGAVGSGKSSLIKTMYGEVDIHDGNATLFGEYNMRKIKRRKLQSLRRRIGVVFQDFQLLTDRSVYDNLDFVLRCTGWKSKREREKRIAEVLELVELPQKGYKMPHELSGGEQQRIVIARAILNRPELILADEPTGNLDNEAGRKIMTLLHRICREEGTAVIMITHNEQWPKQFPAREFYCKGGRLTIVDVEARAVNNEKNDEARPEQTAVPTPVVAAAVVTPAVATEMPAAAVVTPVVASVAPVVVTETPAVATEIPATATEPPAVASVAPSVASETPAAATETPAAVQLVTTSGPAISNEQPQNVACDNATQATNQHATCDDEQTVDC